MTHVPAGARERPRRARRSTVDGSPRSVRPCRRWPSRAGRPPAGSWCAPPGPSRSCGSWSRPTTEAVAEATAARLRSVVEAGVRRRLSALQFQRCAASWPWSGSRGSGVRPDLAALRDTLAERRRRARAASREGCRRRGRGRARRGRRRRACPSTGRLREPGRGGCARRRPGRPGRVSTTTATGCIELARGDRGPARQRTPRRRDRRRRHRGVATRRCVACKDALWAIRKDRIGDARGDRGSRRRASHRVGRRSTRSTRSRSRSSALDRLEVRGRDSAGPARARHRARPRPRRPDDRAPARATRGRSVVHRRRRCARPPDTSRSSTRPRPRSASSATTPRACAPRSATTSCCVSRCAPTPRRGGGARAHALGEHRHHLRGERAPAEPGGARRRRSRRRVAYVDRRAQRRRRQLRRPQGARRPAASRPRSRPTPR